MALLKIMHRMQKFLLPDNCLLTHVLIESDLCSTSDDFANPRGITPTSSI